MSMDAGGLAQMTYNNFQAQSGIGMPTSGFGSRGKGAALKRLSLASPPKVGTIAEDSVATPRTSRSHLLAGLRTAPKTPTSAQPPASAPYNQRQHNMGNANRFPQQNGANQRGPQTAIGNSFTGANQTNQYNQQSNIYDQVLAPPSVQYDDGEMDPNIAAQLLATELYLAQRQQQLQQQLLTLTAQQFGNMHVGGGMRQQQQYAGNAYTPQMNAYQQQFQNTPAIQETGQPGLYIVFNQLTGQYQYVMDPSFQQDNGDFQNQLSHSPPPPTPGFSRSPPKMDTPVLHVSPPNEVNPSPWASRSTSPPKKSSTPPADVVPLPPPSANAFRRGHKKNLSSLAVDAKAQTPDGPRSAFVRPVGFPATPMTGTFGPGQARAGEHPVRQPRGPPSIEDLREKPTTKHEGSKNFATRTRRQAVGNLVRAGIDRRSTQRSGSGSVSPDSDNFPSSDNDSDSVRSRPSIGSLRAVANGAIGSERKASQERSCDRASVTRSYTADSVSSDDGSIGGGLVDIRPAEQRRMPKLILTSAEKRKSTMF
ncbi:hypothetical protein HBI56_084590 [Parastagonospora nodorum]|nr:hypothetical protein HBH56_101950 [Parastagonospora nodorum]KAH3929466.1 hypothetical protein HBH54_128460 [Parastagonospora nodorum]KAH3951680.1 hypothetical protein HBH53_062450 [Parastagonospora nodorum]KAH3975297.1 hypothetical protein HBH52_124390 [Parastagonospora nodorum]KAH3978470.1 hypothetical protein HBH51_061330 [Parastagonospora nodorum]